MAGRVSIAGLFAYADSSQIVMEMAGKGSWS
jgi:predicted TIM-barrel enzyme